MKGKGVLGIKYWPRPTAAGVSLIALVALSGCLGFDDFERTQQVRSDYQNIWTARAEIYRAQLAQEAIGEGTTIRLQRSNTESNVGATAVNVRTRGALDMLETFAQFRQSEPVLSATVNWMRGEWDTRIAAIRELGVADEKILQSLAGDATAGTAVNDLAENSQLSSNMGGLEELLRISRDLVRFQRDYQTAFRADKKEENPVTAPTGLDSATVFAIINATKAGAGR